jgi:hypothetical protein
MGGGAGTDADALRTLVARIAPRALDGSLGTRPAVWLLFDPDRTLRVASTGGAGTSRGSSRGPTTGPGVAGAPIGAAAPRAARPLLRTTGVVDRFRHIVRPDEIRASAGGGSRSGATR